MNDALQRMLEMDLRDCNNRHFVLNISTFRDVASNAWVDTDKPVETFWYSGTEYVAGGVYGQLYFKAWRVVDLRHYQGNAPITLNEHRHLVNEHRRERGNFEGIWRQMGARKVVFCEKWIFIQGNQDTVQLSMF